jgi:SAM-dependent methyltransferase
MTDPVQLTRETYDRIATSYDEQTRLGSAELFAHRTAFAAAVTGRIADLGCGPGRDLEVLGGVGVDLSEGMLALACTRGAVVRGDLRCPPFRPSSLGGVWSNASLLHVPRGDVPATLSAWHRVLQPGGVLGLSTSLGHDEGWEAVPYASPQAHPGELSRWFVHHEQEVLLRLIGDAGFMVDRVTVRSTHRNWLMVLATA